MSHNENFRTTQMVWGLKDGYIMQEILVIPHSELHLLHIYMYINLDV